MRPKALTRVQRLDHPVDVARPFLWIAAVAFAIGFSGYMAVLPLMGG